MIDLGYKIISKPRFDSFEVHCDNAVQIHHLASLAGFNLRILPLGASLQQAQGFGVAFDEQEIKKVPTMSFDKKMDLILTPTKIII